MKKIISTEKAPGAVGPYSQGVEINGFVFFSGQIPLDPATGKPTEGSITEQTRQVLKNIDALLTSENMTAQNVVKTTVFLTDMNQFSLVNQEYGKYFTLGQPARSCVEVAKLPLGAAVEIEVIAARNIL